jgi:hypothetical protein
VHPQFVRRPAEVNPFGLIVEAWKADLVFGAHKDCLRQHGWSSSGVE